MPSTGSPSCSLDLGTGPSWYVWWPFPFSFSFFFQVTMGRANFLPNMINEDTLKASLVAQMVKSLPAMQETQV